jgi:hypothetical protein
MRRMLLAAVATAALAGSAFPQSTFAVTGTPIPAGLLQQNYGAVPKGVTAYDLSICNVSATNQSILSTQIYQALASAYGAIQPIGRQIMLAAILRNQNRSPLNLAGIGLSTASTALSILSSSKLHAPSGLLTSVALLSMSGQQVLNTLRPALSADQLQNFESQVLEQALVLDAGSCAERTMFAAAPTASSKAQILSFRVR